ncbi:hypothetical protein F4803DRAFT_548013 [Xylaria telfairii]|nr:hypothetical protein F4803DRAFT_548013 [Xylaria telfairii]
MAPSASPAKPVKRWDDTMVTHLFLSIYNTVDISFTPEDKIAIEKMMNEQFNHELAFSLPSHIPLTSPIFLLSTPTALINPLQQLHCMHAFHSTLLFALDPYYYFIPATMSSSRKLMNWSPEVHEDILVAAVDSIKNWEPIIQTLHGMGYSFTESALK